MLTNCDSGYALPCVLYSVLNDNLSNLKFGENTEAYVDLYPKKVVHSFIWRGDCIGKIIVQPHTTFYKTINLIGVYSFKEFFESFSHQECLDAAEFDGDVIQYFTKEQRTPDVCLLAVRNGNKIMREPKKTALKYLSRNEKTTEVCIEAIRYNGSAIVHVPEDTLTVEMCKMAIRQDPIHGILIPSSIMNEELIVQVVKERPELIAYFPQRTEKVCLAVVKRDGYYLRILNVKERTVAVCEEAVRNYPPSIHYVPNANLTKSMEANYTNYINGGYIIADLLDGVEKLHAFERQDDAFSVCSGEDDYDFHNEIITPQLTYQSTILTDSEFNEYDL